MQARLAYSHYVVQAGLGLRIPSLLSDGIIGTNHLTVQLLHSKISHEDLTEKSPNCILSFGYLGSREVLLCYLY